MGFEGPQHLHAVFVGKAYVQEDHVWLRFPGSVQTLLPGVGADHLRLVGQHHFHGLLSSGFVVYEKKAGHGYFFGSIGCFADRLNGQVMVMSFTSSLLLFYIV